MQALRLGMPLRLSTSNYWGHGVGLYTTSSKFKWP
jgi:hypothetical protein